MSHTAIVPYCLSMVVCDSIWRDSATSKFFLLGTFSDLNARDFPCIHHEMAVFIELTDGRGEMPFKITLIDADEEREPLMVLEGKVDFEHPREVLQYGLNLPPTEFPEAGEYRLKLEVNGEFIIERRIVVLDTRNNSE